MAFQGWANVVDYDHIHTLVLLTGCPQPEIKNMKIERSSMGRLVTSKTPQQTEAIYRISLAVLPQTIMELLRTSENRYRLRSFILSARARQERAKTRHNLENNPMALKTNTWLLRETYAANAVVYQ